MILMCSIMYVVRSENSVGGGWAQVGTRALGCTSAAVFPKQ